MADENTFRLLDWAMTGVGGLLALLWGNQSLRIKKAEDAHEKLSDALTKHEILVAGRYVQKEDLKELSTALFRKLDTLESLMHQKADK